MIPKEKDNYLRPGWMCIPALLIKYQRNHIVIPMRQGNNLHPVYLAHTSLA